MCTYFLSTYLFLFLVVLSLLATRHHACLRPISWPFSSIMKWAMTVSLVIDLMCMPTVYMSFMPGYYSLFRNNWHPIFLRKQLVFLGKRSFFYTNRFEMHPEFLLSTLFSNWRRRLNLFKKARFLENRRKKLWNLVNTSRWNQVNSCSYYSFGVPRKLYRITSDCVATQSLSSVVNRILNDTQRSAGQFFSEQTVVEYPVWW